jgi:hypothetical protein
MTRDRDFYLLLLSYVLVEIRFLSVEGDLSLGPRLADIFHGVPEALRLPWTVERELRIYEQIRAKAEVHGLSNILDRWEARAQRRQEYDQAQQCATANNDAANLDGR